MMRKILLLSLALLLPGAIFLFLHFFGKNEFDVPILFREAKELPPDCAQQSQFPYMVKSSAVDVSGGCVVLFSSGLTARGFDDALFQLGRLNNEFGPKAPRVVILKKTGDGLPMARNEVALDTVAYREEQKCVFLAGPNRIVLVDREGHIRGLYPDASLEEIDRLIVEVDIIFKKY